LPFYEGDQTWKSRVFKPKGLTLPSTVNPTSQPAHVLRALQPPQMTTTTSSPPVKPNSLPYDTSKFEYPRRPRGPTNTVNKSSQKRKNPPKRRVSSLFHLSSGGGLRPRFPWLVARGSWQNYKDPRSSRQRSLPLTTSPACLKMLAEDCNCASLGMGSSIAPPKPRQQRTGAL